MSNNILQLRGTFNQKKNNSRPGAPSLPAARMVTSEHVRKLRDTLVSVQEYWDEQHVAHKPLVVVRYLRIIPKSGRIRRLLMDAGSKTSNDTIVGARFYDDVAAGRLKHEITHCVSKDGIARSVIELEALAECVDVLAGGSLTSDGLKKINEDKPSFKNLPLERSTFSRLAVDVCNVDRFLINSPEKEIEDMSLVTLYKGALMSNREFLREIGVSEVNLESYDDTTFLLTPEQYQLLYASAPQLIAMALKNVNEIPPCNGKTGDLEKADISEPGDEPWVGVIDTPFNKDVYFSDWVESSVVIPEELIIHDDYRHGTCVSSIIVDGPSLNPMLDDGCGRFRVRHVGVATGGKFSSFSVMREIERAVIRYPEVKVWNLSLGSVLEVPENFISPEGAMLDRIQSEHDVIFVVAGTNDRDSSWDKRLGAPADSINSLVVNSARYAGDACSYSRRGPVLSFFAKPDVCYYGGDYKQQIQTCWEPNRNYLTQGTSFAAPWIARKLSYLINVAGFSRELAKALIIDSACGWDQCDDSPHKGYGVVPIRIEDILTTPDNEIKFVLNGRSELFDTYSYNIPVPLNKDAHPYKAKATMCYFPHCERNQGVDYTSTELAVSFGRIKGESIKPIDNNFQDVPDSITYEEQARKFYRKWDNVKHISETLTAHDRAKKSYGSGLWGLSIKTKERLDARHGKGIRFGIVITLHAIDGVNRIEEFIQRCSLRTWIVNEITIENQIEIYNEANQEIEWD